MFFPVVAVVFGCVVLWMRRSAARFDALTADEVRAHAESRGRDPDQAMADIVRARRTFRMQQWFMTANAVLAFGFAIRDLT